MEKTVELMRGRALVAVTGASPENFLNICAERGISISDCRRISETELRCIIARRYLPAAERCAERAQCELKVLRRAGLAYTLSKVRRRYFLLGGLFAVLILLGASGLYIWDIDIVGNETVSDSEILDALSECGVYIGANWTGFNSDMIRSRALELMPQLSFITVNVHGSRATVIVRERIEPPALESGTGTRDMVARRSGVVEYVNAFRGFALVSAGSPVLEGDTVISGTVPGVEIWGKPTEYSQVNAAGEVWARTFYEFTAMSPLVRYKKDFTGREATNYALILGGKRINFYSNSGIYRDSCDTIYDEWDLAIDGVFTLPVALVRETRTQYELTPVEISPNEAEAGLRAELSARLSRAVGEGQVLSAEYQTREDGDCIYVTLNAVCLENIAVPGGTSTTP